MRKFSPDAPIVEKLDGALTFRIPPAHLNVLGPLLGALEELRANGVVEECGITETSLEDVFLGVTREAGFKYFFLWKFNFFFSDLILVEV